MTRAVESIRKHPLAAAIIAMVAVDALVQLVGRIVGADIAGLALQRIAGAALALAAMRLLGRAGCIKLSFEGMGYSFRKSIAPLAVVAVVSVVPLFELEGVSAQAGAEVLGILVLCIAVGVYEEAVYRGLLFGGLLSRFGGTSKGILAAAAISSAWFGLMHVMPDLLAGSIDTPIAMGQLIGKSFLTAGIQGLLFCAIYLCTRNLWGIAAVHVVFDFISMASQTLRGTLHFGSYVTPGGEGVAVLVAYLVLFAVVYLPVAVMSIRMLRRTEAPQFGPFKDAWSSRNSRG